MAHLERLKRHFIVYGSITQYECAKEYGNYRLSEYIRQLRESGWKIKSQWCKGKNRFEEETHFVNYILENREEVINYE